MAWSCNQVPFKSTFPEAEKFLLSHLENGGASFSSLGPQGKAYTLWAIKGRVDGPPQAIPGGHGALLGSSSAGLVGAQWFRPRLMSHYL